MIVSVVSVVFSVTPCVRVHDELDVSLCVEFVETVKESLTVVHAVGFSQVNPVAVLVETVFVVHSSTVCSKLAMKVDAPLPVNVSLYCVVVVLVVFTGVTTPSIVSPVALAKDASDDVLSVMDFVVL